jgi:hypothetical protein
MCKRKSQSRQKEGYVGRLVESDHTGLQQKDRNRQEVAQTKTSITLEITLRKSYSVLLQMKQIFASASVLRITFQLNNSANFSPSNSRE